MSSDELPLVKSKEKWCYVNFARKNLSSDLFGLYVYLISYVSDKDGYAFPPEELILDEQRISKSTLNTRIDVLVGSGYIIVDTGFQNRCNRYYFVNYNDILDKPVSEQYYNLLYARRKFRMIRQIPLITYKEWCELDVEMYPVHFDKNVLSTFIKRTGSIHKTYQEQFQNVPSTPLKEKEKKNKKKNIKEKESGDSNGHLKENNGADAPKNQTSKTNTNQSPINKKIEEVYYQLNQNYTIEELNRYYRQWQRDPYEADIPANVYEIFYKIN